MFDLDALAAALAAHGRVARVAIAALEGSAPREVGAAMLVWDGGQTGTIGGGALEWEARARAIALLERGGALLERGGALLERGGALLERGGALPERGGARLDRVALGPGLGQCCGGAVTLWTEVYTHLPAGEVIVRSTDGRAMPLAVRRLLAAARGAGQMPAAQLVDGWMIEPVARPVRHLWVWGAGHVGRAVVAVLAPLPGLAITWVDVSADRFPADVPPGLRVLPAPDPAQATRLADLRAEHLILTYSHALDLELCHRLLLHGFARAGLIGSATKWARFRSRLAALGHGPAAIARIDCPIGDPGLGKHPQAIAIGVAARLLAQSQTDALRQEFAR